MSLKNNRRRMYYQDKARLGQKLKELGITSNQEKNEDITPPIAQKYRNNPDQYFNKMKSYNNDLEIRDCISRNNIHIAFDKCGNNFDLLLSNIKNTSVHDIPNQNGKYKNKKINNESYQKI